MKNLSRGEFYEKLRKAGWSKEDADKEVEKNFGGFYDDDGWE